MYTGVCQTGARINVRRNVESDIPYCDGTRAMGVPRPVCAGRKRTSCVYGRTTVLARRGLKENARNVENGTSGEQKKKKKKHRDFRERNRNSSFYGLRDLEIVVRTTSKYPPRAAGDEFVADGRSITHTHTHTRGTVSFCPVVETLTARASSAVIGRRTR